MTTVAAVMVTTPRLYFFDTWRPRAHHGVPRINATVYHGPEKFSEGARNDAGQLLRKAT